MDKSKVIPWELGQWDTVSGGMQAARWFNCRGGPGPMALGTALRAPGSALWELRSVGLQGVLVMAQGVHVGPEGSSPGEE